MVPLEDEEVSAELAKRYKKLGIKVLHLDPGRRDRRHRRQGRGHRHDGRRSSRRWRPTRCCRPSASPRASRATAWRTPASSSPSAAPSTIDDFMRTNVPHIFAIGDVTGEADARARRRGDGHRRRRDHRRRGDDGARLRDDPAGDLLPAADRQLRLHRGAGPRAGLRRQGREVPVHGQRQGARPRRRRRLRQADQRRASTASSSAPT